MNVFQTRLFVSIPDISSSNPIASVKQFVNRHLHNYVLSEEVEEKATLHWSMPKYVFKVKLSPRRGEEEIESELSALEPFINPDLKDLFRDLLGVSVSYEASAFCPSKNQAMERAYQNLILEMNKEGWFESIEIPKW
jgi:hypothetical protein